MRATLPKRRPPAYSPFGAGSLAHFGAGHPGPLATASRSTPGPADSGGVWRARYRDHTTGGSTDAYPFPPLAK